MPAHLPQWPHKDSGFFSNIRQGCVLQCRNVEAIGVVHPTKPPCLLWQRFCSPSFRPDDFPGVTQTPASGPVARESDETNSSHF